MLLTSGLGSHFWFFVEIQLNGIAFKEALPTKLDKNNDPIQKTFLINAKIFMLFFNYCLLHLIHAIPFLSIKYLWMSLILSTAIAL